MYIYRALINSLRAHMIHINQNMIVYTHVEHSPTKTNLHEVLCRNTNTHTHTYKSQWIHMCMTLICIIIIHACTHTRTQHPTNTRARAHTHTHTHTNAHTQRTKHTHACTHAHAHLQCHPYQAFIFFYRCCPHCGVRSWDCLRRVTHYAIGNCGKETGGGSDPGHWL